MNDNEPIPPFMKRLANEPEERRAWMARLLPWAIVGWRGSALLVVPRVGVQRPPGR